MRAKVTERGVLIPRSFLKGVEEVEIRQQDRWVVVVPADGEDDPIVGLGKKTAELGLRDGAENHDKYLCESQ